MGEMISRRDVLHRSLIVGASALFGAAACGKEQPRALVCSDTTGLSTADVQVRTALAYADASPDPAKHCSVCQQFIPATPNACGTCKVVKGPINPNGYCKSFAAKTA